MLVQLQTGEKEQDFSLLPIQVSISVQLWRLPGCHEFLAALGESPKILQIHVLHQLIHQHLTHHSFITVESQNQCSRSNFLHCCCLCVCVSTGFDLCEVGQEEVVLKTGKLANRRTLHFALQSLLALFGRLTS